MDENDLCEENFDGVQDFFRGFQLRQMSGLGNERVLDGKIVHLILLCDLLHVGLFLPAQNVDAVVDFLQRVDHAALCVVAGQAGEDCFGAGSQMGGLEIVINIGSLS